MVCLTFVYTYKSLKNRKNERLENKINDLKYLLWIIEINRKNLYSRIKILSSWGIFENYIVKSTVSTITQSFSSGSTIFGDSNDDTHRFTGSLSISGSIGIKSDSRNNLFIGQNAVQVLHWTE